MTLREGSYKRKKKLNKFLGVLQAILTLAGSCRTTCSGDLPEEWQPDLYSSGSRLFWHSFSSAKLCDVLMPDDIASYPHRARVFSTWFIVSDLSRGVGIIAQAHLGGGLLHFFTLSPGLATIPRELCCKARSSARTDSLFDVSWNVRPWSKEAWKWCAAPLRAFNRARAVTQLWEGA